MDAKALYHKHLHDPRRERGFLSALGFTGAFGIARAITHAIKNGVGPFGNISAGGTHIHHSTLGIFGLLGLGYAWTYQFGTGDNPRRRWGSRVSATTFGVAAALTLDEFALWLDLEDDYWNQRGRKSIDAVVIFAGLLTMSFAGRGVLKELGLVPKALKRFV
jgi:hypothetical protein